MVRHFSRCLALLGLLFTASFTQPAAFGQGLLVNIHPHDHIRLPRPIVVYHPRHIPPPESTYKIKELDVHVRLLEQVARVQVSQSFINTGSRPMEVCFIFPLPYDGAIDQLTLLVDGKEYPAKLLDKEKARRIYEEIVRKNKDPALLEWLGTGMFQTSVFPVPPGAERKVTLRYSQLCRKDQGLTDFQFPLSTAKYTSHAVERVNIHVAIESQDKINSVYSPSHSIEVKRESYSATVSYTSKNEVPVADFRLFYDVGKGRVGTSVLSYRPNEDQDGYFLLLTSPEIKAAGAERTKKTVVFVVDRSGSMSGKKIEQAKGALKFVLNNLHEGDLFNIVAYDSAVESFRPELQRYDDKTRQQALGFIEGIYAGGSTDINGALTAALDQLSDSERANYVLFLTDGLPTAGETNEMRIVQNAKTANGVRARIVAFGVGYDVNSRLLDKLVRVNYGQSEYVRPDEDIEERVSRLYDRIESPVMTDVKIDFALDEPRWADSSVVNRVYPREVYDLFAGEQLVLVGRYKKPGQAKVTVTGAVGGKQQEFDFPAKFTARSSDDSNGFIEKLWAVRRIGEIIDELDLKGKNEELIKELVELSLCHGILTPYTSFLAEEETRFGDVAGNIDRARRGLEALREAGGQGGFSQRAAKADFQNAQSMPAASAPGAADGLGSYGVFRDAAKDQEVVVEALRNIANKSFYRRSDRWVDSTVSDEMAKNATRVEQFSDKYFELANQHGRKLSQYLILDEPMLVNIDGQAYLIEPSR